MASTENSNRSLTRWLIGIFAVALIMGPGPGIALINPSPDDPIPATVFGAPIVYVWTVFWFLVMASAVLVAYYKVWNDDEEEERS